MSITEINLSVLGKTGLQTPLSTNNNSGGGQQFGQMLEQQMGNEAVPATENTATALPVAAPEVATESEETASVDTENSGSVTDWLSLLAQTQAVLAGTGAAEPKNPLTAAPTSATAQPTASIPVAAGTQPTTASIPTTAVAQANTLPHSTEAEKKPVLVVPLTTKVALATSQAAATAATASITETAIGSTPTASTATDTSSHDEEAQQAAENKANLTTTAAPAGLPAWSSALMSLPAVNTEQTANNPVPISNDTSRRTTTTPNNPLSNAQPGDMSASAARALAQQVADTPVGRATPLANANMGTAARSVQNDIFDTSLAASTDNGTNSPVLSTPQTNSVSNTHTNSTTPPAVQHVATPFGSTGWEQAISQRVLWMTQDKLQSANITLNPPQLGPVQVTVQLDQQQATVQFVSASPEVRQALQDALPVLRDLLSQSGIQLGQTNVGSQQFSQSEQQQQASQRQNRPNRAPEAPPETEENALEPIRQGQGLVNLIA